MKILYFDAFSGASGDMILGSLVDLGADYAGLRAALAPLARGRFELRRRRVVRAGIAATKIDVRISVRDREERSFREIAAAIRRGRLSPPVRDLAIEIFRRLCEAEAAAHGVRFNEVHLHEAGALDAIADVCGAAWLIHAIGPARVLASALNVGSGTIVCRHGTYPVPGPATARLLRGLPVYAEGSPGERLTPTGAAILSTVVTGFGPLPGMILSAVGHGAGDTAFEDRPNVLRALLGEVPDEPRATPGGEDRAKDPELPGSPGEVFVVETTIDDMNPQNYGFLMDRLLAEGALEVFLSPVFMKKGRPGTQVTAIVRPEGLAAASRLIFRETSSIGVRYRRESRRELFREIVEARTPWGRVRMKVSGDGGDIFNVQPEYEDCRRLAEARGVPLKEIQQAALAAWTPRLAVRSGARAGVRSPSPAKNPRRRKPGSR